MVDKIKEKDRVKCPWCSEVDSAESWNTTTFLECITREMKRAFKPIYDKKVWGKDSDNYYKCPKCGMWSKGNQLNLVDKNGERIKGLGGRPVLTVKSEKNTDVINKQIADRNKANKQSKGIEPISMARALNVEPEVAPVNMLSDEAFEKRFGVSPSDIARLDAEDNSDEGLMDPESLLNL